MHKKQRVKLFSEQQIDNLVLRKSALQKRLTSAKHKNTPKKQQFLYY